MKRIVLVSLFLLALLLASGQNHTISGYVVSANDGEPLVSATLYDAISGKGAITNNSGFFSLSLPKGSVALNCKFIGYEPILQSFVLQKDTLVQLALSERTITTGEVVIKGTTPIHEQTLMGKTLVTVQKIESMPSFAGQADVLKAITFIPGVSSGREGYSNIIVRGGDRGQNLILLDGAKLYNTNHLGGFVSLFNTDVLRQVEVYKGGFPARYGGRLSSVIDVQSRDGNRNEMTGAISLGLLSSSLTVDGPIGDKISYLVSARSSYLDLFQMGKRKQVEKSGSGSYMGYTFYDLNGKITYHVSPQNKWSLSMYTGEDYYRIITEGTRDYALKYKELYSIKANNSIVSLVNNRNLSPKLFLKSHLTYSTYGNAFTETEKVRLDDQELRIEDVYSSKINELNFQSRGEFYMNNRNTVKAGVEYSHYWFVPGRNVYINENDFAGISRDTVIGFENQLVADELAVYLEDEFKLTSKSTLNVGGRFIGYTCNNAPFYRFEPRISFSTLLGSNFSAKANFTQMHQFNHVLINNVMGLEREIWLAANEKMPPQRANQLAAGLFYSVPKYHLEFSMEGYYKTMSNLLEYTFPANGEVVLTNFDDMVYSNGKGETYGLEFQTSYSGNRINTSLNYTLAWNNRQFAEINNGEWFPFLYDRRHSFNYLIQYDITKQFSVNANFVYSTGTPISLPEAWVSETPFSQGYYIYSSYHNRRLPDYHRLDLALVKRMTSRRGREQSLTLNIYNAYARQNATYIYLKNGHVYQKSMFSIIPSVSYSIKF
jgi:hypothetical protein